MPERNVDTAYWSDPFVRRSVMECKLLYLYLWTNPNCNAAGLYYTTIEDIAHDTAIPIGHLPDLLIALEPKVKWWQDSDLVWVKNFVKRQSRSPTYRAAVAKALTTINNNGAVKELLEYNEGKYRISIPYQYYMDKVSGVYHTSISNSISISNSKGKEGGPGEEGVDPFFKVFTDEVGAKITPFKAEQLKDFASRYSYPVFAAAVKEAVNYGQGSNLRYIEKIAERLSDEGKSAEPRPSAKQRIPGLRIER